MSDRERLTQSARERSRKRSTEPVAPGTAGLRCANPAYRKNDPIHMSFAQFEQRRSTVSLVNVAENVDRRQRLHDKGSTFFRIEFQ
jgi:hypothetical protein